MIGSSAWISFFAFFGEIYSESVAWLTKESSYSVIWQYKQNNTKTL